MDLKDEKSIKILNLAIPFSLNDLKRNYYKLSLKLHPDKNNSPNTTSEFQELKDAYEYLSENIDTYSNLKEMDSDYDFFEILNHFTSNMTGKTIDKTILVNIIEKISENKSVIYRELFEGIDKQTSMDLFEYLKKYAELFNISNDTLVKIGDIINEKFKHDERIKLHQNISNLMNDDIYKLEFDNNIYYVHLWNNEINYDLSSNNQLIINVITELERHISIDDYNNIHVHLTKNIKGLLTVKNIVFNLGEKVFDIPCEDLYLKKKQKYIYKRKGISKIDTNDVYDVTRRGDIIIHLTLLDI